VALEKQRSRGPASPSELAAWLRSLESPEVRASLDELRSRYGKHAVPVRELRKMLDARLGDRTLTQELSALRRE